jgi:hypothetical protein
MVWGVLRIEDARTARRGLLNKCAECEAKP